MKQKLLSLMLLLCALIVGSGSAWGQAPVTIWSENFSGYNADAVPSGTISFPHTGTYIEGSGTLSYTCTNGTKTSGSTNGGTTAVKNEELAGGSKPEIMVGKKGSGTGAVGGSFTAVIPLDNFEGTLTLTYYQNKQTLKVSSTTSGVSGGQTFKPSDAGQQTITFTGITSSMTSITIVFEATTTNNVRLDDIVLTGYKASGGGDTPSITASDVNIAYSATNGSIAYSLENGEGNVTASTTSDWLSLGTPTSSAVPFTCSANASNTARTATVTLSYTGADDKVVTVTQAAAPNNISAITAANTSYSVVGTVVATNARGFVIGDGTGYVYTYLNAVPSQSVGNLVSITGTTGTYGQVLQFTNSANVETAQSSNYNNTPAIQALDATGIATYSSNLHLSDYVQLEGTLVKSNNYYNLQIEDLATDASIAYPNTSQTEAMDDLLNKTVIVKGYFAGMSSGHFNVVLESVEEVTNPTITTESNSLTGFTYVEGNGPSTAQTVSVSGSDLTANISLSLGDNSNYEMCLTENGTYTNSLTLTQSNGSVSATNVYVRLKSGLSKAANYAGTITLTSTDATTKTVSLSGSVTGQTYAITVATGLTGGSIEADHTTAEAGETISLTANPGDAYTFGSWSVYKTGDQTTTVTVENDQFTMPGYAVTVTATFTAKPTYAVTCVADPVAGGTISASPASAYEGQSVELTVIPAEGYTLSSVVITKTSDGSATDITVTNNAFTMPAYAVTATATFEVSLERTLTIDFESASNSYSDWTFSSLSCQQTNSNVDAYEGSYFGSTSGDPAYIVTKSTIANPVSLTCHVSKQSKNTTTSTWKIQIKGTNDENWTDVESQDATSMSIGSWVEFSADLSSYSDVYVRVYYSGSTAVRNIDDLTLTYEIDPSAASITTDPTSINLNADSHNGSIGVTWTNIASGQSVYWCDANGDAASYDWISASINGTTHNVDYTVNANTTGAARTAYLKVHGVDGSSANVYSSLVTINQSKPTVNYTLVSSLTPGKKYIIASGSDGSVKAMGSQGSNNRPAVTIVNEVDNGVIEIEDEVVAEFVVYGPDANGFYTLSDGTGYLYPATGGNYLRTQTTNDMNGKWDITIDSETNEATVVAQGGNTNKNMHYNSSSSLFSCYGDGSSITAPVFFYEKADAAVATTAAVTLNGYGYATYASANALDFLDADNANYSAWKISRISGETITFDQITETTVEAGTGILLKGTPSTIINLNILPVGGLQYNDEDNLLVGTTAPEYFAEGAIYGLAGNTFKLNYAGTFPANKAYIRASAVPSNVRAFTFVFVDPTTGITETQNVSAEEFGAIFNLAGQRLNQPQRGVNIINGKKVLLH